MKKIFKQMAFLKVAKDAREVWEKFREEGDGNKHPKVSVIQLHGAIMSGGKAGTLSLDKLRGTIKDAFNKQAVDAVALDINSPGGSPVQSDMIGREIRYWADKKKIPVYSFVQDVAASGGYWLACAGDEIHALPSSITGSIGVISASFGFDKLIEKLGIERRVHTAGDNKSKMDPFMPVAEKDVEAIKDLQLSIHEDFKDWVKLRRGDKLKGADSVLMNGDFWTSSESKELGLIDGIGELQQVMREKLGEEVKFIQHQPKGLFSLSSILSGAAENGMKAMGEAVVDHAIHRTSENALWKRFKL